MIDHIPTDDLSALIDDALQPARRSQVEAHLVGCASCRDELASLRWAVDFARAPYESLDPAKANAAYAELQGKNVKQAQARIVEMLWEMVYADGTVHEFEDNALWRIAELLNVPSRERIRLRKMVERDRGED